MRLEFERSGGFAGHTISVALAGTDLAAAHQDVAAALLAGTASDDDAAAPSPEAAPPMGADRFEYRLKVKQGNRSRTYRWTEGGIPPRAAALVAELTDRAAAG